MTDNIHYPTRPGHGTAVASMVLGIIGIFTFWLFGVAPILAFVLSMDSRTRTKAAEAARL